MSEFKQYMENCCVCGERKLCSCAQVTPILQSGDKPIRYVVALLSPKQIEQRVMQGASAGDECYICDDCAEKEGHAPKGLWITWIVAWVLTVAGLALNVSSRGAINPVGITLGSVGVMILLFTTLFLVMKAGLGGKGVALGFLSAFVPYVGLIALPLLRKKINHNEKIVTALKKWAEDAPAPRPAPAQASSKTVPASQAIEHFRQSLERSIEILDESTPALQAAQAGPVRLPGSAARCAWADQPDAAKMLEAIEKTWGVRVRPYRVSEADARAMEQAHPMAPPNGVEQAQYAVEMSANSVYWHEYGSWVDFKYAKFLYGDKLYYVNVAPTVQLTQSMYDRKGDLNNMAKILLCLAKQAGPDRDLLVCTLDGNLHDQT